MPSCSRRDFLKTSALLALAPAAQCLAAAPADNPKSRIQNPKSPAPSPLPSLNEQLGLSRQYQKWLDVLRAKSLLDIKPVVSAPNGDFIAMFPDGDHASTPRQHVNRLLATRSTDGGLSWAPAASAFGDDEKHFTPLFAITAATPNRLYAFETQHLPETRHLPNARAFGYRTSDDNGRTWTPAQLLRRATGNPNHNGVGVIQMTVTPAGTFLIGFHNARILRGALLPDGAREWTLVSPEKLTGPAPANYAMDELRLISIGGENVIAFARTREGHLWKMRSTDDGKTFSNPQPTPLVHPDSPPMIFHLNDGKTLIALIHNRAILRSVHEPCHSKEWTMPMPTPEKIALGNQHPSSYRDWASRAELWISLSTDNGETWTEPRFLIANALAETLPDANPNYNLAYTDLLVRDGQIHLIIPHRWQRVIHLVCPETTFHTLSTKQQLRQNPETHCAKTQP